MKFILIKVIWLILWEIKLTKACCVSKLEKKFDNGLLPLFILPSMKSLDIIDRQSKHSILFFLWCFSFLVPWSLCVINHVSLCYFFSSIFFFLFVFLFGKKSDINERDWQRAVQTLPTCKHRREKLNSKLITCHPQGSAVFCHVCCDPRSQV